MRRPTRLILTALTTMSLVLVYAASSGAGARAATAYPPGGPDPTPVMGWSGWSFLRLGADTAQVQGEAKALVSTGLAAVEAISTSTSTTAGTSAPGRRAPTSTATAGGW